MENFKGGIDSCDFLEKMTYGHTIVGWREAALASRRCSAEVNCTPGAKH
jgi:hypothetical protein